MANICDNCGKGKMIGRQVTFSGKRNRRVFKPNLHIMWVKKGNKRVRKKFCTKCLRKIKKQITSENKSLQTPTIPT